MGSFGFTAGPGKPGLGGNPGWAKPLGLLNLGVLLESVLQSPGLGLFLCSCLVKGGLWLLGHKGPMSSPHRLDCDLITSARGLCSAQLRAGPF